MKNFKGIVREEFNRKSLKDRRKKVDLYVCEYEDDNGYIYRKAMEFKPGTDIDIVKQSIPKTIG